MESFKAWGGEFKKLAGALHQEVVPPHSLALTQVWIGTSVSPASRRPRNFVRNTCKPFKPPAETDKDYAHAKIVVGNSVLRSSRRESAHFFLNFPGHQSGLMSAATFSKTGSKIVVGLFNPGSPGEPLEDMWAHSFECGLAWPRANRTFGGRGCRFAGDIQSSTSPRRIRMRGATCGHGGWREARRPVRASQISAAPRACRVPIGSAPSCRRRTPLPGL